MKKVITSVHNQKIKDLLNLKKDKDAKFYLVEGEILVSLTLSLGLVVTLLSVEEVEETYPFEVILISKEVSKKLSSFKTSPNIFAVVAKNKLPLDLNKPLIYLDDVSDPGNVGTIIRSALAFDFGGVIASPRSASFYNEKVVNSAKGAHFHMPLVTLTEDELIKFAKENGYTLTVSRLKNAQETTKTTFSKKTLLVVGNEAHGVSEKINKAADKAVYIPIKNIESLNVAIAASIIMEKIANNN